MKAMNLRKIKGRSLSLCLILLASALAACGGGGGGGGGGVVPVVTGPYVLTSAPAAGAAGVATNTNIQIFFSETMDAAATTNAFTIQPNVIGVKSVTGSILTFTPNAPLPASTLFTVTIYASQARNLVGVNMSNNHIFTFTTGTGIASGGPARVNDLAVTEGPGFGLQRLAFTAPAPGEGGAVVAYQIRYAPQPITDETFAAATPLPATAAAIPAPVAAGAPVTVEIDATKLPQVDPGEPLRYAMRSVAANGAASLVSNGAQTTRPWLLTLAFVPSGGNPLPVAIGQQTGATDATDGFDTQAPPATLGSFDARITLTGRPEALLRDIRGPFVASGEQTEFRIQLSGGVAGGAATVTFPDFSDSAFYAYTIRTGNGAPAPVNGTDVALVLDGAGELAVTLAVTK